LYCIEIVPLALAKLLRPLPQEVSSIDGAALHNKRDGKNDERIVDVGLHAKCSKANVG
jgi:hypothetical protein